MSLQQIIPNSDSFAEYIEKTNAAINYISNLSPSSLEVISITSPTNNQLLRYNNSTQFFENKSLLGTTNQVVITNNANDITLSLPQNIHTGASPTFAGVTINAAGELRLADSDSSHYIALKAPATVSSNVTLTFPATAGSNGQVLTTNGSGTLSWATATAFWQATGNKIYYNTDNVGIGVSDPSEKLQVTGNISILDGFLSADMTTGAADRTAFTYKKNTTTSSSNVLYSIIHKDNGKDSLWNSFDSSTSKVWLRFRHDENEVDLIDTNFKFKSTGYLYGDTTSTYLFLKNATGSSLGFVNSSIDITTNQIAMTTNSVERLRITSAGLIGIATTSPDAFLHVLTAATTNSLILDEQSQTTNATAAIIRKRGNASSSTGAPTSGSQVGIIDFYSWDGTSAFRRNAYLLCSTTQNVTPSAAGAMLQFFTSATGSVTPAERMRILNNGNILIGTTTDSGDRVNVSGSLNLVTGNTYKINGTTVLSATQVWGTLQTASQGNITSVGVLTGLTVSGAVTINNTVSVPSHAITANSFVGSNTTTSFTSEGNIIVKTAKEIRFNNSANTFHIALRAGALGTNLTWILPTSNGTNGQYLQTDGAGNLAWSTVSVGSTNNPGGVAGNVQYHSSLGDFGGDTGLTFDPATDVLNVGSNVVSGGSFISNSDRILKTNIEPIPDPLEIVSQLTGYKYFRKDLEENQFGLIAQDVQKVLPSIVKLNGNYLAISYTELIPILLEAIKDLNEKVTNANNNI